MLSHVNVAVADANMLTFLEFHCRTGQYTAVGKLLRIDVPFLFLSMVTQDCWVCKGHLLCFKMTSR